MRELRLTLLRLLCAALIMLGISAPSHAAASATEPPDEPVVELPSPLDAARLFGSVADTSQFLMIPTGSLDTLASRVRNRGGRPVVVVQYGDSHTQAGILPRELRDQLAGGGRTSPGFVAPGLHNLGDASVVTVGHWKKKNWIKPADAGSFGPLGVSYVTHDPRGRVMLHLKDSPTDGTTVTAFYSRAAAHLPFSLSAGGVVLGHVGEEPLPPRGSHPALGLLKVTLPPGATDLALEIVLGKRAGPELRFFGFLVQEPGAVVEWDSLGVTGTSVEHPLFRADRTLEEYLALRQPDLVVVWFGSNSLVSPTFDPTAYQKDFGAFLTRLANASPTSSRLAIGPPDLDRRPTSCATWYGHHKRHLSRRDRAVLPRYICEPETTIIHRPGKPDIYPVDGISTPDSWRDYIETCAPQTLPAVKTATDAERDASKAQGYAFFDTFAFMDGPGSIHRWACQTPRLAAFDLVHLTAEGYSTLAQGMWGALPSAIREPAAATASGAIDSGARSTSHAMR